MGAGAGVAFASAGGGGVLAGVGTTVGGGNGGGGGDSGGGDVGVETGDVFGGCGGGIWGGGAFGLKVVQPWELVGSQKQQHLQVAGMQLEGKLPWWVVVLLPVVCWKMEMLLLGLPVQLVAT